MSLCFVFRKHTSLHPVLNVKYLAKHKLQVYAGAISKLVYGITHVRAIIHSQNLVGDSTVRTNHTMNVTSKQNSNLLGSNHQSVIKHV